MALTASGIRTPVTSRRKKTSAPDELLRVLAQLMIEKKSLDVSFVEISARSGLGSALIKYYFGSKQGLFLALVERDSEHAVAQLRALQDMQVSAPEKLRRHIAGIIHTLAGAPYLNQLVQHLATTSSADKRVELDTTFIHPIVEFHRALIAQGVREGTMRDVDPLAFFFMIFGTCDHIFSRSYALKYAFGVPEEIDDRLLRAYVNSVVDIILNGVTTR